MCHYHREDIEGALRAFNTVRHVEFLNDHGTVLVQYQPGS
jgi:copper chaperone CopZ